MKKALLFLVCCVCFATITFAQSNKSAPYMPWEVGADLGISLFGNDFNMNKEARWNSIDHWSSDAAFGGELYVRKYFGYVIGAELAYSYNNLKGDWDESFAPNTQSFHTRVNDITLQAVMNFNNLFSKNRYDRDWYIFGKVGVGIGWVNNKEGEITSSDSDDTKYLIPLGLGAAYKITDDIKVSINADYKFMNTDRLDGKYEIGVTGAGKNTGVWGSYAMFSVGASYTFGKYRGQKMMASTAPIPSAKPAPRPTSKSTMTPKTPTNNYKPKTPTNNYKPKTMEKPTPKPVMKPTMKPATMSYSTIDGIMMAKSGWPVNKGYVYGEIPASGIKYRVQVFATYHQAKSLEKLGNVIRVSEDLIEYRGKKLYKYAATKTYDSYSSALAAARQINRTAKISDAFVVAFKATKHIY